MTVSYCSDKDAVKYSYFCTPKVLFSSPAFKGLSCEAKILYSMMLDRMGLSVKNGWLDAKNRAYIIFTLEEIMDCLGCSQGKGVKLLAELDKGMGLIERVKQGQGKPTIIYVKQFTLDDHELQTSEKRKSEKSTDTVGADGDDAIDSLTGVVSDCVTQAPVSDLQKTEVLTCKNQTSALPKNRSLDLQKLDTSKTEYSKPDFNHSLYTAIYPIYHEQGWEGKDRLTAKKQILENIGYENLLATLPDDVALLDELVDIMAEVMLTQKKTMRVNGEVLPSGEVKNRFAQLEGEHIAYALDAVGKNTTEVRNIRAYLITTLYNASQTAAHHRQAQDNYGARVDTEVASW